MTKKTFIAVFSVALLAIVSVPSVSAAQTTYYYIPGTYQIAQPVTFTTHSQGTVQMTQAQLITYLQQLIIQLQTQLAAKKSNQYHSGTGYSYVIGEPRSTRSGSRYNDYEPEVETISATNIGRHEARLRGEVDMNDFEDGEVFFIYGTDQYLIEDVAHDYDSYRDVNTRGERLSKVRVDSGLDRSRTYNHRVTGLSSNTRYHFSICVGYEDDRGRDTLTCGDTLRFTTDRN